MYDLNTAPVEKLAQLPGLNLHRAYDLLLARPFVTWAEVEHAPGCDGTTVEALKAAGVEIRIPH